MGLAAVVSPITLTGDPATMCKVCIAVAENYTTALVMMMNQLTSVSVTSTDENTQALINLLEAGVSTVLAMFNSGATEQLLTPERRAMFDKALQNLHDELNKLRSATPVAHDKPLMDEPSPNISAFDPFLQTLMDVFIDDEPDNENH